MDNQENNVLGTNPVNQEPVSVTPVEPVVETPVQPAVDSNVAAPVVTQPVESVPTPTVAPAPVQETAPVAPVQPTAPVAPVVPTVETPVQEPVNNGAPLTPPQNKGSNNNLVFIIIVVALVLVIGVLGVMVLNKKGGSSTGGNSTTTTTTEETFTKSTVTTDPNAYSTTRQTYDNQGYTTTSRVTKTQNDPQSVRNNSSVFKVDNYEYNIGGDLVVYSNQGQSFIYDTKDDAEILIKIFNGESVSQIIPELQTVANNRMKEGFEVIQGNYGVISGVNVCYLLLQDADYLYYEIYLDTGYGDLARYLFLSKKQFTVDSVVKLIYQLNTLATKKSTGVASAGFSDTLPVQTFDERLLSE